MNEGVHVRGNRCADWQQVAAVMGDELTRSKEVPGGH